MTQHYFSGLRAAVVCETT